MDAVNHNNTQLLLCCFVDMLMIYVYDNKANSGNLRSILCYVIIVNDLILMI